MGSPPGGSRWRRMALSSQVGRTWPSGRSDARSPARAVVPALPSIQKAPRVSPLRRSAQAGSPGRRSHSAAVTTAGAPDLGRSTTNVRFSSCIANVASELTGTERTPQPHTTATLSDVRTVTVAFIGARNDVRGTRTGPAVSRTRPGRVVRTPRTALQVRAIRDAEGEVGLADHLQLWLRALELAVAEGDVLGHQAALISPRPDVVAVRDLPAGLGVGLAVRAAGLQALRAGAR